MTSKSIEVKGISADAFEEFLQFFYRVKVHLTHENVEDVITLAKTSLVDEFFTACMEFLTEALAIENVCQSYHLAVLHEFEPLIERCEQMITLNSDEIFASIGFITCDRVAFFNILQLDALSTKEVEVFKASISWAKNYCSANGLDATKPEELRRALADSLYQIRFGTMNVEEFMRCYKSYKNIFTEGEREEILFTISKVCGSDEVKMFNDEPRGFLFQKLSDESSIKCDRVLSEASTVSFYFGVYDMVFSCNQPILLEALTIGAISEISSFTASEEQTVTVIVTVSKRFNDRKTIFKRTKELIFKSKLATIFHLHRPIMIKPTIWYDIKLEFKSGLTIINHTFNDKVSLDDRTTIEFHENSKSPITSLMVNICKTDDLRKEEKATDISK